MGAALAQGIPGVNDGGTAFCLLKTGLILEGTAVSDGEKMLIKSDFGSMTIPVKNIEFFGKTKQDVYRYKRSQTNGSNYSDVIKLAEWCISNGLNNEGITEYQQALRVSPNPMTATIIRQRLDSLTEPQLSLKTNDEPEKDGIAAPQMKKENGLAASFAKKVQPILVARCASADCHGSNSPQKLKIGIPQQHLGRTTYNNYAAVKEFINFDYPAESKLLAMMTVPHGGNKSALSVESKQYHNVIQWIQTASKELPFDENKILAEDNQGEDSKSSLPASLPKGLRDAFPDEPQPVKTANRPDVLSPDAFNRRYH
ncbi:hypothetical protein FACS189419_07450 [Planctomycetales bacterium]|nr:hypothetical protein FACS189419_07450 [Planctomycetales bacterium]